jgi:hypothetical protein
MLERSTPDGEVRHALRADLNHAHDGTDLQFFAPIKVRPVSDLTEFTHRRRIVVAPT